MVYLLDLVFSNQTILRNLQVQLWKQQLITEDYELIAEVSKNLGAPMKGIEISKLDASERMQDRGI